MYPSVEPLRRRVCEKARWVIIDSVDNLLTSVPVELLMNSKSRSSVDTKIFEELVEFEQNVDSDLFDLLTPTKH